MLRSLADDSVRSVPRYAVKPLVKFFSQRCQEHFCASKPFCTSCVALIKAVQWRCTKRTPPVPFATGWRELDSSMDPPPLTDVADEGASGTQARECAVSEGKKATGKRPDRPDVGGAGIDASVGEAGSQSWSLSASFPA